MKDVLLTVVSLGIGASTCAVMWCKSVRNEKAAHTNTDTGREGR